MRSKSILFITILLSCTQMLTAVPARRNKVCFSQPDGSSVYLQLKGDENGSCLCTEDGYMVMLTPDSSYVYATDSKSDASMPESILAHNPDERDPAEKKFLKGLGLRYSNTALGSRTRDDSSEKAKPGDYSTNGFPTKGNMKGLVLLAEFPDKQFHLDDSTVYLHYNRMLNEQGYTDTVIYKGIAYPGASGSVKDYFESQSYGQLSPEFDVIGPIMADSSYAYYGTNASGSRGNDAANTSKLVKEICKKAYDKGLLDPSLYDNDNDGTVDFVCLIYAGRGENYLNSDPSTIWPHQSYINLSQGGINFYRYTCSCELFYDSEDTFDGIGCFCHEFLHVLGLPDYYDTGGSGVFAMDAWSVMDYGMYDNNGFAPVGMTAFERFSLGWMDLEELSEPGHYTLCNLGDSARAYRISTENPNQFLVLESHNKDGWYSYHPAEGLMVTAVNYSQTVWNNNSVNNNSNSKGYGIIAADNIYNYSAESLSGDLYPWMGNDSLTLFSTPSSKISGWTSIIDKPVYNIEYKEGKSSFSFLEMSETGLARLYPENPVVTVYGLDGKIRKTCLKSDIFDLPKGIYLIKNGARITKVAI